MKRAIEFSFTVLKPRRYLAVLLSTICLVVLAPLIEHNVAFKTVLGLLIVVCSLVASLCISTALRQRVRVVTLAILTSVMWTFSSFLPAGIFHAALFEVIATGVCILFFANVIHVMLEDILTGPINSNRVCGALCIYILLGFCFALLHTMIATLSPGSYTESTIAGWSTFQNVPLANRYSPFVYFSFCTLSTVGFGDIVPVGRLARTITWLEAVIGQFYMAVLVARLVGLHVAKKHNQLDTIHDTSEFRKFSNSEKQDRVPALVD